MSQSLWNRAVSYDIIILSKLIIKMSQSLWNRAVSYDPLGSFPLLTICLNPFGTGQCLTTKMRWSLSNIHLRLNPFGTGQCLTTVNHVVYQGDSQMSQSLWNRAVSYDH